MNTAETALRTAVAPQRPMTPTLSVVIVNYRQWRNTARLSRQLLDSVAGRTRSAEVVIVDNCSSKHPLCSKLRRTDGVSVRRFGRNHGFAYGVNEGCRLSRGEWFLLLNPDVTVPPGFLDAVRNYAERLAKDDPKTGVVGFKVCDPNGARQPTAGDYPTFVGTLLGQLRKRSIRKCRPINADRRKSVPWLTGCCLLVRRDCFNQIGGFDTDFFLYYEDVDFCKRARTAGWSVWFEPLLKVTHHHPLHTRKVPPRIRLMTRHSLLTYARKHWPAWQFRAMALIVWIEARVRRKREQRRGHNRRASLFRRMGQMALDLFHGKIELARRRMLRVVQHRDGRYRRTEGIAKPAAKLPVVDEVKLNG
jgi:N-acetylglucosaminyl-diphospho-decaprenol L-rhamnosyltransferase